MYRYITVLISNFLKLFLRSIWVIHLTATTYTKPQKLNRQIKKGSDSQMLVILKKVLFGTF